MQVREVMNPHVVTIDPAESAALAARLLARHNIGALPVCSANGQLQGIVTDRDIILRCVAPEEDPASIPVKHISSGPSPRRKMCVRRPGSWPASRSAACRWWKRGPLSA